MIRPGELWGVLSQVVTEHGIDLLVAGTHGNSWLGKTMGGSATELIFRNASCPVLPVGPHAGHPGADAGILRILFPTDLEHISDRALSSAITMSNEHNAQVIFLHVLRRRGLSVDYPDEEDLMTNDTWMQ